MTPQDTRTVAVVGASTDRRKFGNKAVRAYVKQGWQVYPISVKAEIVEGLRAYASLGELPVHINRVTIYLPPSAGMALLEDIAALQPDEVYVNPGAESVDLLEEARKLGLDPILACSILAIGEEPD